MTSEYVSGAPPGTYNIFECAECGRKLAATEPRYGWVTVPVGLGQARVHTLCRTAFARHDLDEQKRLVGARS